MTELVWIALALPLAGCVAARPRRALVAAAPAAGWFASLVMLAAFGCSVAAFVLLRDKPEDERVVADTLFTWLSGGASFRVDMSILFDPLSAVMLLVVTGVGFLIHVYSIGYMRGDDQERRFFAYLNLFVFSMLLLVAGGQLRAAARRLGPGRPLELPADRLLARAPERGGGGQEGVRDERDRRRRPRDRASS